MTLFINETIIALKYSSCARLFLRRRGDCKLKIYKLIYRRRHVYTRPLKEKKERENAALINLFLHPHKQRGG